jgi:uroporphyrinogen decarboxylase
MVNHRERVLTTLEHRDPDRVPLDLGSVGSLMVDNLYFAVKEQLEIKGDIEPYRKGSTANYYDERILDRFDIDFRHIWIHSPDKPKAKRHNDGTITDEWGITWSREGSYPVYFPLKDATLKDLEEFNWPIPEKSWDVTVLRERARHLYEETDYAVVAKAVYGGGGLLERSYYLRTIDNFFIDMALDRDFALCLVERVAAVEMALWDIYLKAVGPYVHIIQRASDLGTQLAPFISPALYREVLKPYEEKVFSFLKERAPQAKIWFHSCGAVSEIIDDFIEIGVDILNPVQPLAVGMDSSELKKRYGKRLCFHGGIDIQKALPGSIEDVKKEIETRIDAFGPGGGYILAPVNHMQDDTPAENVVFLYEYAREYGQYPMH